MLAERLVQAWYRGAAWLTLLLPLSWLFRWIARRRRQKYLAGQSLLWQPPVPVIVVGNITVGGTGKSPLVAALVRHFREQGWRPGVISRGYGGNSPQYPLPVAATSDPALAGDEPVMLARQVDVPLVVDPDRVQAAQYLLTHTDCDLIISDDGMQHYRLKRHLEILVLDAMRGLGNGHCLPAGPLREPVERIDTVTAVVSNGGPLASAPDASVMKLEPARLVRLADGAAEDLTTWRGKPVHAVAGIGNPERFFQSLRALGMQPVTHAFGDHHVFRMGDLSFDDQLPVIMTAKDAVKCRDFGLHNLYVLEVQAVLDDAFFQRLHVALSRVKI